MGGQAGSCEGWNREERACFWPSPFGKKKNLDIPLGACFRTVSGRALPKKLAYILAYIGFLILRKLMPDRA